VIQPTRLLTLSPRRLIIFSMATPPRFFESDIYYHVYNRGNRKQNIFAQDRDFEHFLEKIIVYKKKFKINIDSYCLMPNHFHFIIKQSIQGSISRFISDLCNSHSRYFNTKYETVGSLFQGRFKAKWVDKDEYLIHLSRYIHLNPIDLFMFQNKNIIVNQLLSYKWSSLRAFVFGEKNEIVNPEVILQYFNSKSQKEDYKDFVVSQIENKSNLLISHLEFEE
jgi:putative transposase